MNRRQVLGAVSGLGVSFSGCTWQGAAPTQSSDSPTASSTPSSPPSPTVVSGVEVPPCPEKPASLTRETVVRFATQFERAYRTRLTLRDQTEEITSIRVSTANPEATETEDGWLVRFGVIGPAYRYRPHSGATETDHVDPSASTAHYLVTEGDVIRAISIDTVDPRESGIVVQCPPE